MLDSRAEGARVGQSLVSVLVGAGVSMAMLGGVITMIQYSQKAGQGVQGKSDFGALVDSVRSITSSADACKTAFVDASGAAVKIPAPSAGADSSVEAQAIRVGGADFMRKGEKAGAVQLQAIRLTRPKGTSDLLSVQLVAQKQGEVLGGSRDLQNVKPLLLQASFGADGAISSCQMGGAGSGGSPGAIGSWCGLSVTQATGSENVEMIKIDGTAVPKGEKRLVAACLGHDPSVSCPAGYVRIFHWSTAEVMRTQTPGKLEFCVNVASSPSVAGVQSCPQGMSLVGNPGSRSAYCIDTQRRPKALFKSATQVCFSEGKKMCNHNEWSTACHQQNSAQKPSPAIPEMNLSALESREWIYSMQTWSGGSHIGGQFLGGSLVYGPKNCDVGSALSDEVEAAAANTSYRCCTQ